MAGVREEVFELIFAGAVVVVFGSAAAAIFDRISRATLLALTLARRQRRPPSRGSSSRSIRLEGLAVAAGGLTVCAALQLGTLALSRLVARTKDVDARSPKRKRRLDSLVTQETESHAAEIERKRRPCPRRLALAPGGRGAPDRRGAPHGAGRSGAHGERRAQRRPRQGRAARQPPGSPSGPPTWAPPSKASRRK